MAGKDDYPPTTVGPASPGPADSPPVGSATPDAELLELLRTGDQDAAEELYRRYAGRLRSLARARCAPELQPRFDSEDVVQSVFRKLVQYVRKDGYAVPSGEELWGLLTVLAVRTVRSHAAFHRAQRRNVRLTISDADIDRHAAPAAQAGVTGAVLKLGLEEALGQLPPSHQAIVQLRMESFEVAEIATRTGRSRRSVERVLQSVRVAFQELLTGEPHAVTAPEPPDTGAV